MPVYNAEKYLKRSIESVINQSYKKIELIFINDGSTDGSAAICNKYVLKDRRLKVISQKHNGPAAARNTGLVSAAGEVVFFLDADDYIEKNAIKILAANYHQYQADLVMANFNKLENSGQIVKQRVSFDQEDKDFAGPVKKLSKTDIENYVRHFLRHPSNHLISYCWARLYKLSIIRDNNIKANEKMRLFEDYIFNLDYLSCINKAVLVNEPLYTYTMHNDHISASMAIIKADSLLHDLEVFKSKTRGYFRQGRPDKEFERIIDKEVGHALVHYVIIFMVRSCRLVNQDNYPLIYQEIKKIVKAPILRNCLNCYDPQKGDSRVIPLLVRLKLVALIMKLCGYKADKRYGKAGKK